MWCLTGLTKVVVCKTVYDFVHLKDPLKKSIVLFPSSRFLSVADMFNSDERSQPCTYIYGLW